MCRYKQIYIYIILSGIPTNDWEDNIHEHGALFAHNLHEALLQQFPCKQKPPRKTFISDDAWQIRAERRSIRRRIVQRKHTYCRHELIAAFQAWKCDAPLAGILRDGRHSCWVEWWDTSAGIEHGVEATNPSRSHPTYFASCQGCCPPATFTSDSSTSNAGSMW